MELVQKGIRERGGGLWEDRKKEVIVWEKENI